MRQRGLQQWGKNHPKAIQVRQAKPKRIDWETRAKRSDEEVANILICLIYQASYLLTKQMQWQEENFLKEGGFTERMYHARKNMRGY